MVTVVTRVRIKGGQEDAWDEAFRERAAAAREQEGFVFVQLCRPEGSPSERVVVGTWQTRANWESWHDHPTFVETRERLEEVDDERAGSQWYEVVVEERR
jgi:heme-degrading monooxygenase HmoA